MDALDLAIKNGVRVHDLATGRSEPIRKVYFSLAFGLEEAVTKSLVIGKAFEFPQLLEISDPVIADGLGDGLGERRVTKHQPAPRCDAVCFVVEALGKHLSKVLDR